MTAEKGLVDLHRLFCSADPQILGIAKYKGKFLTNTFISLIQSANDEILAMHQKFSESIIATDLTLCTYQHLPEFGDQQNKKTYGDPPDLFSAVTKQKRKKAVWGRD